MSEGFDLKSKIVKQKLKAVMQDTTKWGRIPMIDLGDGSLCAEQISYHYKPEDVEECFRRIKKRLDKLMETYEMRGMKYVFDVINEESGGIGG